MHQNNLSLETTISGHHTLQKSGLYFHSKHNPIEEAKSYAEGFFHRYQNERHILLLGVGLGYHIKEISELYKTSNIKPPEMFAVDPNTDLKTHLANINPELLQNKHLTILTPRSLDELFSDSSFMRFLSRKPKTITWNGAFSVDKAWYEVFLKFRASESIRGIMESSKNQRLKHILADAANSTLGEFTLSQCLQNNGFNKADSFLIKSLLQFRSN